MAIWMFRRGRDGRFRPGLRPEEVELLQVLCEQAMELLEHRDPAAHRVFPVAYPDDPAAQEDFRAMMDGELLKAHRLALDTLATTAGADAIDEEQLGLWLESLEVLRLVLGTKLEVTEDPVSLPDDDPRVEATMLYDHLTWLQDAIVQALASALPEHPAGP